MRRLVQTDMLYDRAVAHRITPASHLSCDLIAVARTPGNTLHVLLADGGEFDKLPHQGVGDSLWVEMEAYAKSKNLKAGDYKKLNLPFENKLWGQPREIRERMVRGVEDFVHELLTQVFHAQDTAPLAIEAILKAGTFDLGPKASRIESPSDWTEAKIKERAAKLHADKGPKGNFDD